MKRIEELVANPYLLTTQKIDIQVFKEKLNASTIENIAEIIAEFSYDFETFVSEELILFYQETLQSFRLQRAFFVKKYHVSSVENLSENYQFFSQIPENEKDSDEIVWETLESLYADFTLRLNDLLHGNQKGN